MPVTQEDLIIVGAGDVGAFLAHNLALFDASYRLRGFVDDDPGRAGSSYAGHPILGPLDVLSEEPAGTAVAVSIATPRVRERIVARLRALRLRFPRFVAHNAWVSPTTMLGEGVIIYPGTSINHSGSIGDFVIINMNCALGHNATIGECCTLAPGVLLGGFTSAERCADIGIGAATRQRVTIGAYSVVGGQAMVLRSVPPRTVVAGVPARPIRSVDGGSADLQ